MSSQASQPEMFSSLLCTLSSYGSPTSYGKSMAPESPFRGNQNQRAVGEDGIILTAPDDFRAPDAASLLLNLTLGISIQKGCHCFPLLTISFM